MTGAGEEVIGRLGETFRAWIIANLPDVGEDEVAAVDAVIARIVKRVVREEATPGRSCPSGYRRPTSGDADRAAGLLQSAPGPDFAWKLMRSEDANP
jgi:hypothetical protein